MTSTGRVLFSKGDSTVAAPRGEIAKRHKQPEHVAIGLRNNEAGFGQCERASERAKYVERTRSVASCVVDGKYFYEDTRANSCESELPKLCFT